MAVMADSTSIASPAYTPRSKMSSRGGSPKSPLTLDLSDLPPLIQPSPPTNTLLVTNLDDPSIFHADNLQKIRDTIDQHVAIHTFSPLKSFRRIIVTFHDISSASFIKQTLDGEVIMDCRVRVYYGAHTDLSPVKMHLQAPKMDKLFFISPPPSPPHDWESRNEEPPNKDVHADDLAEALSHLHARAHGPVDADLWVKAAAASDDQTSPKSATRRSRSATLVYHPEQHGSSPLLPAISVEDTSEMCDDDFEDEDVAMEGAGNAPILHTSRPPVELMN